MRITYFLMTCLLWSGMVLGQASDCMKDYEAFIDEAKRQANAEVPNYQAALNACDAAKIAAADCGENRDKAINELIAGFFQAIEKQRQDAIEARKKSEKSLKAANRALEATRIAEAYARQSNAAKQRANLEKRKAEIEREKAFKRMEAAYVKNQRIIDAFYFYEGRYALAFKNKKYGYINKEGEEVIDYKYDEAYPFDKHTGLAKVKRISTGWGGVNEPHFYLIDTLGREYRLAESIEELTEETRALDLSNFLSFEIDSMEKILEFPDLEMLILGSAVDQSFFNEIHRFKNLVYLSLAQMEAFPQSLFQLEKLEVLNLADCSIQEIPKDINKLEHYYTKNKLYSFHF